MDNPSYLERHPLLGVGVRALKVVLLFTIFILTTTTVAVVGGYFYFAKDLPPLQNMNDYHPPVVSEVFSRDGTKIGEFWQERRLLATIDEIPPMLIKAFISSEDARFFEHRGVDFMGVIRAVFENVRAGHVVQGASTITQQITRSLLLTREKKMARKVKEAILATRIERDLSKKDILTLYLNQIYLGNRAYGVKAAAENYFHKELDQLNLAEMAILAGLPQAPGVDNPLDNPTKAKLRQHYVLDQMRNEGYISREEMTAALETPLTVYAAPIDKEFNNTIAPYFVEHVRQMIASQYGDHVLYSGGLKIYTTADVAMSQSATASIRKGIETVDKRRGWRGVLGHLDPSEYDVFIEKERRRLMLGRNREVVHIPDQPHDGPLMEVYNPKDGVPKVYTAIIASISGNTISLKTVDSDGLLTIESVNEYHARTNLNVGDLINIRKRDEGQFDLFQFPKIQGAIYSMDPETGSVRAIVGGYSFAKSEFNRATQALRQPGSAFKPLIYAAALDKGYTFGTTVIDEPVEFVFGTEVWRPKNSHNKFAGATSFMDNLIYSRNIPTIKVANSIGLDYITAFARKLGLTTPIHRYLSMALGTNEVYLSEMCSAYTTFANMGKRATPIYFTKIIDQNGEVLDSNLSHINTDWSKATAILNRTKPKTEEVTVGNTTMIEGAPSDLNPQLFLSAQPTIDREKLKLTHDEMVVLYGKQIPEDHVITPQTAYLMRYLQREIVKRGTGAIVNQLGRPAAGKTGTTNDGTDVWFIGYTPNLLSGVWIGYDETKTLGSWEQGGRTAAPVFLDYMKAATADMPVRDFSPFKEIKDSDIMTVAGGSAPYWKEGFVVRQSPGMITPAQRVKDRAVDFFGDDY